MKHGIWMAALVVSLGISGLARADEWQPSAICQSGRDVRGYAADGQFSGFSTTLKTQAYCALKRVVCASSCTYSVDVATHDGNTSTGTDLDVVCRLRVIAKNQTGVTYPGTAVTNSSSGDQTLSLSVTTGGVDGWISVFCELAKDDAGTGNHSTVAWIGNSSGI